MRMASELSKTAISMMRVQELREELESRGMETTGIRPILQARLGEGEFCQRIRTRRRGMGLGGCSSLNRGVCGYARRCAPGGVKAALLVFVPIHAVLFAFTLVMKPSTDVSPWIHPVQIVPLRVSNGSTSWHDAVDRHPTGGGTRLKARSSLGARRGFLTHVQM